MRMREVDNHERRNREILLINLMMVADKTLTFVTKSEANILTKKIEWCAFVAMLT